MGDNKKYKLSKMKKSGVAIGLSLVIAMGTFLKISNPKYKDEIRINETPSITENIDIDKNDECDNTIYDFDMVKISLSSEGLQMLHGVLKENENAFTLSEYYCLDEAIKQYKETQVAEGYNTSILNDSGEIDESKLYETIRENNSLSKENGKNSINMFYTDLSESDIRTICHTISSVVNSKCTKEEMPKVAATLSKLTVFQKTGGSSNAYVTNNLTFVYNPSMASMYTDIQKIKDSSVSKEKVNASVIVHEIEHLLQYSVGDANNQNGLEAGFCRMYNMPNQDPKVSVDSLYYDWYLEGAAEINATKYVGIEPGTYQKKISYINSINMSRIFKTNTSFIEDLDRTSNIDEFFEKLDLKSKEEQTDFLNMMYSIELTQSSSDDFWNYYQSASGKSLTSEEITALKMQAREDAILNLSNTYYNGLVGSLREGKIKDLNTLFFLMRAWETDAYSHLQYNNDEDSLNHSKRYIEWSNRVQNEVFEIVGSDNNLTQTDLCEMYSKYTMYTKINGEKIPNCDLTSFTSEQQQYILKVAESNNSSRFSRVSDVVEYEKRVEKPSTK